MTPNEQTDRVLLAHMRECLERIAEYTGADRCTFDGSRLVQDAVVRNLQTLTESATSVLAGFSASQRLSDSIKATEPQVPWRELAGFRNVVVHAYLSLDMAVVWSIVAQDLPGLASAIDRMAARISPAA